MSWLICEIQDGAARIDGSDSVSVLFIDWDDIADDPDYAADKLDELDGLTGELPPDDLNRIRSVIHQRRPETTVYYVADTPAARRSAALRGRPLYPLMHQDFNNARRDVVHALADDLSSAYDEGHHADAAILTQALRTALDWRPPVTVAHQPIVYGPVHRGTHYGIRRIEPPLPHPAPATPVKENQP